MHRTSCIVFMIMIICMWIVIIEYNSFVHTSIHVYILTHKSVNWIAEITISFYMNILTHMVEIICVIEEVLLNIVLMQLFLFLLKVTYLYTGCLVWLDCGTRYTRIRSNKSRTARRGDKINPLTARECQSI